ncbi:hypothetical protein [Geodermatophilus sp. DSM 44513]|uniref:hypothetical protein n=1 Tax=Geodermatophilus sp. DSM 44513 TaxID=1528104 RepID=UPI00127571AF|nr:hypothetical protein [Geodermatophilus sp. DSM 44513]WNV76683.1 hypothetical protein RTG05_05260 [Geodermatophilus sp. DSM 44513]
MTTRAGRGWPSDGLWAAVVAGVFYGPALQGVDTLWHGDSWSWTRVVVSSAFFGVGMVLAWTVVVRLSAAAREREVVERVLRTGALPAGAGEEWIGRLAAERRRLSRERAGVPVLFLAVSVLLALGAGDAQGPTVGVGSYLAGLLAAGGLVGVWRHRRVQVAERLSAELAERLARSTG